MRIIKEEVVATALMLLNQVGVEGMTMRRLADALNIQAPSLYWHFANKEALLESMADALIQSVAKSNLEENWETRLLRIASELRQALLSHRDGARVFAGTYPISENMLRIGSLMIECLKSAGLDDRTAIWGIFSMVYFIIGFCIEEQALAERGTNFVNGENTHTLLHKYPLVASAIGEIIADTTDQRFKFGLNLQIESLKKCAIAA